MKLLDNWLSHFNKFIPLWSIWHIITIMLGLSLILEYKSCVPPEPPEPSNTNLAKKLKSMTEDSIFSSYQLPTKEILQGKKGTYYLIDLKSVDTKEILYFELGKYTIPTFSKPFGKSLNAFTSVVDEIKKQGYYFSLHVFGKADIRGNLSFKAKQEKPYIFDTLYIHKQISTDLYANKLDTIIMSNNYENKDLPNLRAVFIQQKLKDYGDYPTEILDGRVEPLQGYELRNASLLLYVNWESQIVPK